MAEKKKFQKARRAKMGWIIAMLSLAMLTLTPACILSEHDGGPEESTTGWTWVSGSDTAGEAGVYGTKGTASASNFPGARGWHLAAADPAGKVWLFGGQGYDATDVNGHLNDLWKYDPTTQEWTWISGSDVNSAPGVYGVMGTSSPATVPGARDSCAYCMDSSGRLWVFGGFGFDRFDADGNLNDLWMFDSASLEWTWMSGGSTVDQVGTYGTKGVPAPSNVPGSRFRSLSWVDASGKIWLFGGHGVDAAGRVGDLNDLWEYDPTTNEWTWVAGSELNGQSGIYGTKGSAAPDNYPGSRDAPIGWRDSNDRVWIFGGTGYDRTGQTGQLNDLWRYDPATLQWTWVSGSDTINQAGVYGTQGTASASNAPGGTDGENSWLDSNGKFWFFGGNGYDEAGTLGLLNDLWKFDPTSSQWTWISGTKTAGRRPVYGTKGVRALSNSPGGRFHASVWLNASGELVLFGGQGRDAHGALNYLNDFWKYTR